MRKLIDANIILRYLLGDHPQMSEDARIVIGEGAYTLPEIIAEVVYVLQGVYKIERDEISSTLKDFLDGILVARHRILGEEIVTFDKKLNKMLR